MSPDPSTLGAMRSSPDDARDLHLRLQAEAWEREQARIRDDEDAHQADRRRIGALFGRPAGTLRRLDRAERLLAERAPR